MRHVIAPSIELQRIGLLERLDLELQLKRGLRQLLLCAMLFGLVVYSTVLEKQNPKRLGLLKVYQSVFNLDDSLASITTIDDLRDYTVSVSQQSHLLQPLSSQYFVDIEGEVLILPGISDFDKPMTLNLRSLSAKVDIREWSFTAWVKLEKEEGTFIIRKPLGTSAAEADLVCWGWFVGFPNDRLDYGAHDFRGSQSAPSPWMLQESVESNVSSSVSGSGLRYVALVVSQDFVEFWIDAELQSVRPLPRPLTDCTGSSLLVGGPGASLGEITFYSRRLLQTDMNELLYAGFTLGAIADGRAPFSPSKESADEILMQADASFAASAIERASLAKQIQLENSLGRVAVDLAASADQDARFYCSCAHMALRVYLLQTHWHIDTQTRTHSLMRAHTRDHAGTRSPNRCSTSQPGQRASRYRSLATPPHAG